MNLKIWRKQKRADIRKSKKNENDEDGKKEEKLMMKIATKKTKSMQS